MAVYYVASKLSFVACKARCISSRRRHKSSQDIIKTEQDDKTNWRSGEVTEVFNLDEPAVAVSYNGIITDPRGLILNAPLDVLTSLLIPQSSTEIDQPHQLLAKLIESVPENDESLERLVLLVHEWTSFFPYDFRAEEFMSLVKHIVARCGANTQLGDRISDTLSALLIKLRGLSQHEEEMKSFKKPLFEEIIEWPSSSKLAQLLCHVEKKFAKHIGPEEFVQCNSNLIKHPSNYDVPAASSQFHSNDDAKKKTCNLENYFEWSNRLRLMVANEILQCTSESDRSSKIELWSSVAQHCLLVGNYNSATSILQPICRLQAVHIEHSQDLNLWSKQTETSCNGINSMASNDQRHTRIQIFAPNSSPPHNNRTSPGSSITKIPQHKQKLEWVVLPVFVDIVKLALKARDDCTSRLPNGSINFCAFNELAAIVSAFTLHMSNVPASSEQSNELNYLVNHILTCPLKDENELFEAFEKEATKIVSYYDVP